ncbi:hypothetical protein KIH87_08490 [Paraneptunicella aestuarii]|uniref:ornithine carbamoyltransferase n=1 Tax=Paraneptunicella aestuarii TaxID=2831148 RepID=UPI001E2D2B6C|nr:hypothetical protein [Paraneptunicella aestuarii]UAA40356.1 hypothetical protein KIH87_08490 [Paraneptunicella aestuarii]
MHFLTLQNLDPERLLQLVERGIDMIENGIQAHHRLDDKIVGLFFAGHSTRTRTSFAAAALKLGAKIIQYGPNELQLSTGETPEDTGRVLAQYLDALVVRTNGKDSDMQALAAQEQMSVINAMSESEHPTQAIADLITIREAFGSFDGLHLVYMGEGNNSAAALAYAVSLIPNMRLTLLTPEGYGLNSQVLESTSSKAHAIGSTIIESHDIADLPMRADVVYTTRWETMGVSHPDPNWKEAFRPFKVTQGIMDTLNQTGKTLFMHDLPAIREQDVANSVLDGEYSIAFRQALHKQTAAMVVLQEVLLHR